MLEAIGQTTQKKRWAAAAVAAGVAALAAVEQVLGLGGADVATLLAGCMLVAGALTAVVATGMRAMSSKSTERIAWLMLAGVPVADTAGRLLWWSGAPAGPALPWPTPTSVGHITAVVLLLGALALLPSPKTDRKAWWRTGLDAMAITVALTLVSWNAVLLPVASADTVAKGALAGVLHVVADVAVGAIALVALSRARYPGGLGLPVLLPLGAGAVAMATGDAATTGVAMSGGYHPGNVIDLFLLAAWTALAAAARPLSQADDDEAAMPRRERVAVLAAVVPVVLAALVAAGFQSTEGGLSVLMALGLGALAALLLARLVIALLDNLVLTRTLELQVQERTLGLVTQEQWFRSLVQNSSDVVTVLETDGTIRYQSPAMERLFGYDANSLDGRPLATLLRPVDARRLAGILEQAAHRPRSSYVLELALWHRDGYWCETETVVTSLTDDPDIRGLVLNTRDVSERKQLQDRLEHQAYHDALTGLSNRSLFHQRLASALEGCEGEYGTVGVLYCDLNGFKAVNDAQGHDIGDALLVLVAERLRHCVRPRDLVARFGGDEFAVLVGDADADAVARDVAQRIARALRDPFSLNGREVTVGVSVGIAVTGPDATTPEVLMRNADLAMYRAKAQRAVDVVVFEPSMHDALLARLEVEDDLRQALGRGQLELHYQPSVDLRTGKMVGVEALMRWYHPERGVVRPDEFISIAEENGFIEAMGEWALFEACRQGARWQEYARDGQPFHIGVNISARQVRPELVEKVAAALADSGLSAGALLLEMTESVLMERADEAARVLQALKDLGVLIAVDDFGTGYSSLSYLSRFPVDVLKIDKHFVDAVAGESGDEPELVHTIVQIGQSLRLRTVAEGIENWTQYGLLRDMGCDLGQGYLFSRPLPASGVNELFADGFASVGVLAGHTAPMRLAVSA